MSGKARYENELNMLLHYLNLTDVESITLGILESPKNNPKTVLDSKLMPLPGSNAIAPNCLMEEDLGGNQKSVFTNNYKQRK